MTFRQPRYGKKEFARRGNEIYKRDADPQIDANNTGHFVAIDIETSAWEIDADDFAATERLLSRVPDAQIWFVRVGHRATYRIGGPHQLVEQG